MTTSLPKLLILAATELELKHVREAVELEPKLAQIADTLRISYLVAGVGPVNTAMFLTESVLQDRPDLVLDVGIAGGFPQLLRSENVDTVPSFALGSVLNVVRETFADQGAEDADGRLISSFELGFAKADQAPYAGGYLTGLGRAELVQGLPHCLLQLIEAVASLPQATGVTLGRAHGSASTIAAFRQNYPDAQVESMEGASVFAVAFRQNLPAVQLRAISNFVEPRNRASWQIELALTNLAKAVADLLLATVATAAPEVAAPQPPSQ